MFYPIHTKAPRDTGNNNNFWETGATVLRGRSDLTFAGVTVTADALFEEDAEAEG
jgi:hypothetical protein